MHWGCNGTGITGADGYAIGTGAQNTIDIEAGCTTTGIAAALCANSINGTYSDWFLPSKDELQAIYNNLTIVNNSITANSGTAIAGLYWSSTEGDSYNAWAYNFGNGYSYGAYKSNTYRVRAVRAF